MHVALPLSNGTTIMGTDILISQGHEPVAGNNISLSLETESKEEADSLFAKLAEEGTVEMPLTDMFWGAYFGMLIDKFGIKWLINFEK
jgi:PhnB protein